MHLESRERKREERCYRRPDYCHIKRVKFDGGDDRATATAKMQTTKGERGNPNLWMSQNDMGGGAALNEMGRGRQSTTTDS